MRFYEFLQLCRINKYHWIDDQDHRHSAILRVHVITHMNYLVLISFMLLKVRCKAAAVTGNTHKCWKMLEDGLAIQGHIIMADGGDDNVCTACANFLPLDPFVLNHHS